jgi:repressor LexA
MKTSSVLTRKQAAVLEFIRQQVRDHGRPPTAREIAARFGYASPRGATVHLQALQRKGAIRCIPGQSRNIRLPDSPAGIPIVGAVAAGQPILAVENFTGSLDLGRAFSGNDHFAVRVQGDSMRDAGILDGDYAVIRRQADVPSGQIAVAYLNGEATVKRLYKTRRGYRLQPENPVYRPLDVDAPSDSEETPPDFHVAGPVVGVVRMVKQVGGDSHGTH